MSVGTRLKFLADVQVSSVDKKSAEGEIPVRLCNYTDVYYRDRITADVLFMDATAPRAQVEKFRLQVGQTLITKDSETADDIGVPAYVEFEAPDLVCGYHLAQITPTAALDPRFLFWFLSSDHTRSAQRVGASGVTRFGLRTETIDNLRLHLPALEEQRRIAAFLDAETERMDQLINAKARTIELLEERRWTSFVERLSERQVSPVPVRRALSRITDGPFGSAFSSSEYVESGVAVVRLGNIGFARWRGADLAFIPDDRYDEFERHSVQEGDVLIAGLGDANNHAGRACVAPDLGPAIVKGKCFRARVDRARADPRFLALFLSSPLGAEAVAIEARGSTRQMINLEIIKSVPIPLPSPRTQVEIVERTEAEWRLLEEAKTAIAHEIGLLRERRCSVITAAVAGEVEVP